MKGALLSIAAVVAFLAAVVAAIAATSAAWLCRPCFGRSGCLLASATS
jgi:hypothetical protein